MSNLTTLDHIVAILLFTFIIFWVCVEVKKFFQYRKERSFIKEIVAPPTSSEWHPNVKGKVTFYGDSIGYGGFMNPDGSFGRLETPPAQLLRELTAKGISGDDYLEIDDRTRNGDTIKSIFETRFFTDGHDGELTIIEAAVNDTAQRYSVYERLKFMIDYELLHGRKVIVTGMSQNSMGYPLQKLQDANIKALVESYPMTKVMWARWPEAYLSGESDLVDKLHPAAAYSRRLVGYLAIFVNRLLNRE